MDRKGESDFRLRLKHSDEAYRGCGSKFGAEEMEVVDKVEEEVQGEEKMDRGQLMEESITMDAENFEEGEVVGKDEEEELEEGQIMDSDTNLVVR